MQRLCITSSSTGSDPPSEIDRNATIWAIASAENGEYFVSGSTEAVHVWRTAVNCEQMATMAMGNVVVNCLAVSKDGRRIAAGTYHGELWMWNAETYEPVFVRRDSCALNGVDFSPDSTRLVVASCNYTASIWSALTGWGVTNPIWHEETVTAAKYSPQGDRIATATPCRVRVYNDHGRLLVEVKVKVVPWYNTGLVWSSNDLFLVSDNKIKRINASTGSVISEWSAPDTNYSSCIALSPRGEFIVYSTNHTVAIWDTSTHYQLGLIQHAQNIRSVAVSSDQFIAIGGEGGKIKRYRFHIIEPDIQIDDNVLDAWRHDRLTSVETFLTAAISTYQNPNYHVLACRALVRGRLGEWDAAIDDASKSIEIQPSVIGYVAKSVALVGKGKRHDGYRECDIALEKFHSTYGTFLSLIKAIILFMAGEYDDAISRVDDLIATVGLNLSCHMVKAYMYLLLGDSHMESSNYEFAIQSFELARTQMVCRTTRQTLVVSLITGWKFDDIDITVLRRTCEAVYAAGLMRDGNEAIQQMVTTFGKEVYACKSIASRVSDFSRQYLNISESCGEVAGHGSVSASHTNPNSTIPTPLLRVWAVATLASVPWNDALVVAACFTPPRFTIYQAICEGLETVDRVMDAIKCYRQMTSELTQTIQEGGAEWAFNFESRCCGKLENLGDVAMNARKYYGATSYYSTILSLSPATPQVIFAKRSKANSARGMWEDALEDANEVMKLDASLPWAYKTVLIEWAKTTLMDGLWKHALAAAGGFKVPRFSVYQALCERLETLDRTEEAAQCLHEMENELGKATQSEEAKWVLDFKSRFCERLEGLGDAAMGDQRYNRAITRYSIALSLEPIIPLAIFAKRSKARSATSMWMDALEDANEVIMLDPLSLLGYERKYVALRGLGYHKEALDAFETMHSKMVLSFDPEICERHRKYARARETVSRAIQDAIRESPRVLINTNSGRLCDKSEQASAFELLPAFTELISSMTTHIDHARIEREVKEYYRYAMFSHKWETNEPLFDKVVNVVVYDLEEFPTHDKLQMFCKIVRDAGFHWAWSDTCCINKADHFVLQEALVAMFEWYRGATLTIIFLRGVCSPSKRGDLVKSVWNSRAWTLQEYHASKVVRFYAEDWTLYLNLGIPNHKDSPEIISEMEEATGVPSHVLMGLHPGVDNIREKLCLASQRNTTLVEDSAYSLLGIFSTSLPVVYGEKDKALGRLLAQLLTSSGDASILAWTGKSGSFNSCLPSSITVFNRLSTSLIPRTVEDDKLETTTVSTLLTSLLNFSSLMRLYDKLNELPIPMFIGQRMKLPCIAFKLGRLLSVTVSQSSGSKHVFHAKTNAFGTIVIQTTENLSLLDSLILVHPWINSLLDRQPVGSIEQTAPENADDQSPSDSPPGTPTSPDIPPAIKKSRTSRAITQLGRPFGTWPRDVASLLSPLPVSPTEGRMQALQFLARLKQPFGALLLTPTRQHVEEYRRVAAECLIIVQIKQDISLDVLMGNARVLDVL